MKIDEVMLGDIVSLAGNPIHVTLGVFNHWSNNIKPIPLTQEILEKNGFEGIKEGRFPSLRNYYNDIIFQLEGIKEEGNCKILYIFKNIPILYVHQLQHALKLCGIDKEIVV
jgi:hypothetical protein